MIISNCVINLSADKDQVLREAFVLKPGGRFAVSDVVTRGDAPADVRKSMLGGLSWTKATSYAVVQTLGAVMGVALANVMFDEPTFAWSQRARAGW